MGLFRLEEITVSKKLVNLVLNFHRNISSLSGGKLVDLWLIFEHLTKAV